MPTQILATKLYIPPVQAQLVIRPRLIEQLSRGLTAGHRLTIVSAPAGSGKTTLVSEWLIGCGRPAAWLSLDEADRDLTRFLTYLVAALQTIAPQIGAGVMDVLQSPQPAPTESILTTLLNEITDLSKDPSTTTGQGFLLVLDDYHVIDAKAVDMALAFLLENMPREMHMVMITREDPNLPLARLRARGQLTELRVADLRFTPSEAAEFLNRTMGLDLSVEEISALEARTEGWVAGLQLAALSMQGQQDVSGFIQAFAGDHRYIVDYLVEEVLQRQPEVVRSFLLQTSILERLNGPLCEAVTGQPGGRARLDALQRGNFFLIPLDDTRHWYRYHHLFADVLRMHLVMEQPAQIPFLHRRASEWYEQNGSAADAIHHALAGEDFERAAGLIELAAPALHRIRQEATVLGWLKALPEDLFRARPVLSIEYVGTIMSNGGTEGVEVRLQDAERWLDMTADLESRPAGMIVVNEDEFRRLPGSISLYRAALALARGDVAGTVTYTQGVLDLVPKDDHIGRGAAHGLMGLAFWTNGDLEDAHQTFAKGMAHLQTAGHISDAVGGVLALADIRITQGRLRDAMHTYERALQLAKENGTPALRGTADMYVGIGDIEREHNDLDAALQLMLKSKEQGEHTGFPQHPYRWRVVMARIREAQGDLDGALELLQEAEPLYVSDFFPNVRPLASLRTRVWLAQGMLAEALAWAREQGLSAEDAPSYLREFDHITLARVLLAQYKKDHTDSTIHEATSLLVRLLHAAQEGGRTGNVIEILVVQALAQQVQGNLPAAYLSLHQALVLAEPEGYVRMFLDEGEPVRFLLEDLSGRILDGSFAAGGSRPVELLPYIDRLLQCFSAGGPAIADQPSQLLPIENLVDPLSQRELEVLRLFKTDLSGPEIARELTVALSTVRTHTKSIYTKLNVSNRRAAVKRGTELGLI